MDEAAVARGADRLLVEAHRRLAVALDARDLGADERRAVAEVLRAVLRPHLELLAVGDERAEVLGPLVVRRGVVAGRARERAIEVVLGDLGERRHHPEQPLRLRRGVEGRGVVARVEARLELADPVPARGDRQARIALEVALEPALVELRIVEGGEVGQEAPERPDEPELPGAHVGDETEPRLLRELQRALGSRCTSPRRIALGEEKRVDAGRGVGDIGEVARLLRRGTRASHELEAGAQVPRPGSDEVPEGQVDAGLEAEQPALLHQIEAELAEPEPRSVVTEARQERAEPRISDARAVAVAMLEAQVRHATDEEAVQVPVGEHGRRLAPRGRPWSRASALGHQGQIDERLDRTAPELLPHSLVLLPDLLVRRVRRPRDADAPEVVEARLDGAIAPIQRRVEIDAHAGDGGEIDEVCGAAREHREPLLGRPELAGQVLALGAVELELEGEIVPPVPALFFQERRAGREVLLRRGVGRRSSGALARDEIELGDALSLRP